MTLVALQVSYRHLVAQLYGLHVMPIGDCNTFLTNPRAPTNIMSATPLSVGRPEYAKEAFMRIVRAHIKARSRIVTVLGDMYYQELNEKDVIDSQIVTLPDGFLKTQEDLERFMSEQIIKPMPFDRPQWVVWVQRKYLDDTKGLVVWRAHHSLADGISSMALNLQLDETYDISKLIPFKPVSHLYRWMVRLMVPFYIPVILWESLMMGVDRNPLHDGRRELTGDKRIAISKEFNFAEIKSTSRALDVTINELMIAALSMATARVFKDRGQADIRQMSIAVPANIRWRYYETYEEV